MSDHYADFSQGDIIKIHMADLSSFHTIAKNNSAKKRYRLCLHDTPENRQQEMLICVIKGDYSRPHKHKDISESHIIIDGSELVILFDNDGGIREHFVASRDNGYLTYRINSEIYHMSIPLSDSVIVYETKIGPFTAESNIYPEWAPDGSDIELADKYVKELKRRVKEDGAYEK